MNKKHPPREHLVTRPSAAKVAHDRIGDKRPRSWREPARLNGVEFDASMLSGQRVVQEVSRSGCADIKVNFRCVHVWYFSPVDLAIGQDRRKRGLDTFKNTIEHDSPFDQGTIKYGVLASK